MEDTIDMKIKSERYGVTGILVNQDGRDFMIQFTCEGDQVKLPFPIIMDEQMRPWLRTGVKG